MEGSPSNRDLRDYLSARMSQADGKAVNIYMIQDRGPHEIVAIVAARGAKEALAICRNTGLDWEYANTNVRRVQRNVAIGPGFLNAIPLHGRKAYRMKFPKDGTPRRCGVDTERP